MTSNYLSTDPNVPDLVFSFNRDELLSGNPSARFVTAVFDPGVTSGFYIAMPGDADGQLPPFGSPLPIVAFYDNGWSGGADSIKIWNVEVDWSTPVPTANVTAQPSLLPAPFDSEYDPSWNDIPQPNTTSMLDGMGGIVQFRAQWRMWTGYNTLMICFPVRLSLNPPIRAIRWMELRQDQSTSQWSIHQQSTYAPDDYCRWMGSIAMDDEGNIALCYAKSGPTSLVPNVYPSLAYTGRLAGDSLNTMTFGENMVANGTSFINLTRFGDYSQTSLDPDGLTFWHTGEFVSLGKRTQVYAFRLSSIPVGVNTNNGETRFYSYEKDGENYIAAQGLKIKNPEVDLFTINGEWIRRIPVTLSGNTFEAPLQNRELLSGIYLVRLGEINTSFQKVLKVSIK
jgi:hypothetical protein